MAAPARAATTTGSATVSATIPAFCSTDRAVPVVFPDPGTLSVPVTDAAGSIDITCTSGGIYSITVDNGASYDGTTRRMRNTRPGSMATLGYALYSDEARSSALDPIAGPVAGLVGTGSARTFTLYARLPAQTATEAGSYSDTIQLTIAY